VGEAAKPTIEARSGESGQSTPTLSVFGAEAIIANDTGANPREDLLLLPLLPLGRARLKQGSRASTVC